MNWDRTRKQDSLRKDRALAGPTVGRPVAPNQNYLRRLARRYAGHPVADSCLERVAQGLPITDNQGAVLERLARQENVGG